VQSQPVPRPKPAATSTFDSWFHLTISFSRRALLQGIYS
jgi:hypothetical protein